MTREMQELKPFGCELDGVQLIEASAGTGKTWAICALVLRLLLERGLEVSRVLVVTFTKAATAELRERVRERLAEVLRHLEHGPQGEGGGDPFVQDLLDAMHGKGHSDADMAQALGRALRQFDEAAIFTIHGFCKRALDDAPLAAGVPLRQDMAEDDRELREEAARDFWRREIAGGPLQPALAAWLRSSGDTPGRLADLLRRHAGKPLADVRWPEGTQACAGQPDGAAYRALHAGLRAMWQRERLQILRCVNDSLPVLSKASYKEAAVEAAFADWDALLASEDPFACVPRAKGKHKLHLFGRASYRGTAGRDCVEHGFFDQAQALLDEWATLSEDLETARWRLLRQFVDTVPAQLRQAKRQRRLVAFDDMLSNLHEQLLGGDGEALAGELRERFPVALIDEFQDTDPLQFEIFDRIYRSAGSLFLVGDPKQAIYSFRNADLYTYLGAADRAQRTYTLAENQRSSGPLIGALNALFTANDEAFMLDGLGYRRVREGQKKRKPFEDRRAARGALQLWQLPDESSAGGRLGKAEAQRLAFGACAAEIASLLRGAAAGEVLHDGRPLEAAAIAVLVRSHREGSAMRAALAALGVGSVELAQTSIFETADAEEVERLLVAVQDPGREGRVRAALATELLGRDAAALEALCADEAAMGETQARLRKWREMWLQRGVGPMLRDVAAREGVHARMLARSDGERRLTNFRHLAECLHEAAREYPGPEALLRWFSRQRKENRAEAFQVRLESDRHLVQIVTIHKSKGLEYPLVFCPGLWNGSAGAGGGDLPGREYHDETRRHVIDYRKLAGDDEARAKARVAAESDEERLRLIYVALTRAVHRLYLVVGGYYTHNATRCTAASRNPLNWLVAAAGRPAPDWRGNRDTPGEIAAAWARFAQALPGQAVLEPLPLEPGVPLSAPEVDPASIVALAPPRQVRRGWQLASYSSLAHGSVNEGAAADHDARSALSPEARAAARAVPKDVPEDDILRFERGPRAGNTMHAVFERVDFADPARWDEAIRAALRAKPPGGATGPAQEAMLAHMARDVLSTPLPAGFTLSQVRRRTCEMEFSLLAPGLSASRLGQLMQRHGYPVPSLSVASLQGFLRGFIDLVAHHEGRWWIVDWKSNHLGWRPEHYGQARLDRAMESAGYHLQYLLYTLALHRWLRTRMAGYDYERHMGGVYYLFVRGVRPDWQDGEGRQAGVFADRPSLEFIEALDAEFSALEAA